MNQNFFYRVAAAWVLAAMLIGLSAGNSWAAEKRPSWLPAEKPEPTLTISDVGHAYLDDSNNTVAEEGAVEVIRERYPNGNVKIERHVVLDASGNYVNHGPWKMLTTKGDVIAEGQYDMGQRVGNWTRYFGHGDAPVLNEFPYKKFKAPFVAQANFVNGVMDGEWLIEDADKHKCVQISFKMGLRHGMAIVWLPNDKMYRQSTFDEGVPVGEVLEVNSKNGEFERSATYVDGRKIVTKTTYFKNSKQKQTEEMFLAATTVQKSTDDFWTLRFADYTSEGKDLRHGPSRSWYASGKPHKEGSYQYDQRSGTFTYWHENGQTETTGEYKNDKSVGKWEWFHSNGQRSAVGQFRDGLLIGEWRWWDEAGKLTKQSTYDGTEPTISQQQEPLDVGQRPTGATSSVR